MIIDSNKHFNVDDDDDDDDTKRQCVAERAGDEESLSPCLSSTFGM
jgi:hypothetical protein